MTLVDLSVDEMLKAWEQEFDEVQCQSILHSEKGYPKHAAHWYTTSPCGDLLAVCETRRKQCFAQGGWKCVPSHSGGCSAFHPYDHIQFHPVKG